MWNFSDGDTSNQAHFSVEGCCSSWETDVSINDFSAFLSMKSYKKSDSQNFLLKISNYPKAYLPLFPENRVSHSWSPPCTPFRMCSRSKTTVIDDTSPVEPSGEQHSLVVSRNKTNLHKIIRKRRETPQYILWSKIWT